MVEKLMHGVLVDASYIVGEGGVGMARGIVGIVSLKWHCRLYCLHGAAHLRLEVPCWETAVKHE